MLQVLTSVLTLSMGSEHLLGKNFIIILEKIFMLSLDFVALSKILEAYCLTDFSYHSVSGSFCVNS